MKTIVLSLLFMICQQIMIAQSETIPGFLWQANINGSEFTFAGSIHAGKKELFPLPDSYLKAYKEANYILFELKDDFTSIKNEIFKYAAKDSLNEDQYLDKYLSQEDKEILSLLFSGKEEILQRYYHFKGWLLNMTISGRLSKMIGYDPELAVDKYFHKLAVDDQKVILGLDKIETQLKLFEFEAPHEVQVQIIDATLKNAEKKAWAELPLFESYYNQDTEAFQEAFLAGMNFENPQIKAMYDKVFTDRNKAWVNKLIELSRTHPGNYFILVGCGHYFGPDNVLDLLNKEGHECIKYYE